jgi:hypothetical protein
VAAGGRKNDDLLATALAVGGTVEGAAHHAGVSERTAFRRLQDPAFRERIAGARRRMFEQAAARLTARSTSAADALGDLLGADSESVRLGAARSILELGAKLREAVELEARVAELEVAVRRQGIRIKEAG